MAANCPGPLTLYLQSIAPFPRCAPQDKGAPQAPAAAVQYFRVLSRTDGEPSILGDLGGLRATCPEQKHVVVRGGAWWCLVMPVVPECLGPGCQQP